MRYYSLFYTINNNPDEDEAFEKKYERLNYWTLEEILCLRPEEEFTAELFWVQKNDSGQKCHSRYTEKSDALNLFMHDMVSPDSSFRKLIYSYCKLVNSEEAYFRTTREEEENGLYDRECKIITCEDMIRKIAECAIASSNSESYLLEASSLKKLKYRFELPKEIPPRIFSGTDLDYFTNPLLAFPGQFRLVELGAENIYKYALAPFYYELAKYCKQPDDPENRDLNKYFVGLA